MNPPEKKRHPFRFLFRWTFRLAALLLFIALAIAAYWLRDGLYNHYITYPKQAQAWADLKKEFKPVSLDDGWNEYRGIIHSHSYLSHDSEVPFEDILKTMKDIQLDFILMSDHCDENIADYSKQWRGMHDGKLFVPGFEMDKGFMPSFLPPDTILKKNEDPATLAQQISDKGGLLFYVHSEEPRLWELPQLNGMEIYNIHTDFKEKEDKKWPLLADILCNVRSYKPQLMRSIYIHRMEILARWDDLCRTRKITGFGGNDCHQNTGYRGFYEEKSDGGTAQPVLRIEDTSPETIKEFKLNFLTRGLLRLASGPLEPGKMLFHMQLDPYELMGQFCNTHVLARDLSEDAIKDSLKTGRAFVGFTLLADCRGFVYYAQDATGKAVMGETMSFGPETRLRAGSPLPCRFNVLKNGEVQTRQEGRELDYQPKTPGKYRVEAELNILGEWTPWIYANPIELK